MKILIIGANGTIGKKVTELLEQSHDVVRAGRSSGDVRVDIADSSSIQNMYDTVTNLDAVICIAGEAKWDAFDKLSEEDFYIGLRSKLMGQVNLVRLGKDKLNAGGSFTLSTGILADRSTLYTTSASMVNGGIHSFVRAAALELPNDLRINALSATLVEDSVDKYASYFPDFPVVPMDTVANGYKQLLEGSENGHVLTIYK